jgi:TIR domain-containing protein
MRPKRTIFISYAAADVVVALRLQEWLLRCSGDSINVFLAADSTSLPAGEEWFPRIATALAQADILIVLVSDAATRSSWVAFEAGFVSARDRPVIPVLLPPFRAARLRPPLAFRQWIELTAAPSLIRILTEINRRLRRRFEPKSYRVAYHQIMAACSERRNVTLVDAAFLNSRSDMYEEIIQLLSVSDGPIHVRATSSLRDRDVAGDKVFQDYMRALASRCAEAPDLSEFTLVMSFPGKPGDLPPRDRRSAIRHRQREFLDAGAARCLTILQIPTYWTLDVMTIGYEHALVGVPVAPEDPHLRGAIRVSHPSLVATLAHWFDECVKRPARLVDPDTLIIQTGRNAR